MNRILALIALKAVFLSSSYAQTSYQYLTVKGKVSLNGEQAQVFLRLRKDSLVWVSVRKAGIEGLRLLANPDSLILADMIHRTVFVRAYSSIDSLLPGMENVDALQAMLLGELPVFYKGKPSTPFAYRQAIYQAEIRNTKLLKFTAQDTVSQSRMVIDYQKYKRIKGIEIPKKLAIALDFIQQGQPQSISLVFEAKKIQLPKNRPDFYFKISKKYIRK